MSIDYEQIATAYRKLKRYVYYDKTDLRLRKKLAEFEFSDNFEHKLIAVAEVLNSDEPWTHSEFQRWLSKISFRIVPKKIQFDSLDSITDAGENGRFITNVTTTTQIEVEKVNYFFDGPIELHLVAVFWIMTEGRFLDYQLGPECCGARLVSILHSGSDNSAELFRKYHEQYSQWRDRGIRKAKQILTEDHANVAILGLDVQEYFYRIRLDFESIAMAIHQAQYEVNDGSYQYVPSGLLLCIKAICEAYQLEIKSLISATHKDLRQEDTGLPIGLCSSVLLANWYLKDFDDSILKSVRPAYYGRYVDDILMVIPAAMSPNRAADKPVAAFIDDVLVKTGILFEQKSDRRYELSSRPGLYLQQGKCILQYFDSKHSIAGLEKFKKKLEENASDFLLLPVDEADSSMEDVAYEIMYEGSVNKFRSVKGMSENRYELAKHLARKSILHLLTDDSPDPKISLGLRKFFKGKNAIEFFDLWERVFTFFRLSGDSKAVTTFSNQLQSEIKRVRYSSEGDVAKRLTEDLHQHLILSRAMADSLCSQDDGPFDLIADRPYWAFRRSNLIRHHFVRMPLLNYTTFDGPLTSRTVNARVHLDEMKLKWSPRYIHFDELLLLAKSGDIELGSMKAFDWASSMYRAANGQDVDGVSWVTVSEARDETNG